MESAPSRIQEARGRAAAAKQLLAAAAVTLFAAVLVGVRSSHPGESTGNVDGTSAPAPAVDESGTDGFDFGSSDVAPSTGGGTVGATHAS